MKRLSLVLALVLLGAACAPSSTDLQEPRTVSVPGPTGVRPSLEQILQAIRLGTARKHWHIMSESPGAVVASVTSGGHDATVRIEYDAIGWVIRYEDSSPGLRYDPDYGGRAIIHQRYNFWVRHLNRAIENALQDVMLQGVPVPTSGAVAPPAQSTTVSQPN